MCLFITLYELAAAQITGIKIVGDPCSSQTLSLQAEGRSNSPYFTWDFGDPASGKNDTVTIAGGSTVPFPTHSFSAPGLYTVCVKFQEPGLPETTVCRDFLIGLCCSGVMQATDACLENNIFFSLLTGSPIITISWNFGDSLSGNFNTSNRLEPDHRFSAPGTYKVTATVIAPCDTFEVTTNWTIISCDGNFNCSGRIISIDTCITESTRFQLRGSGGLINTVQWDFGDPASGSENRSTMLTPVHRYSAVGNYTVTAYIGLDCGRDTVQYPLTIRDCNAGIPENCRISVPNAFSPNGDGRNDLFYAVVENGCPFGDFDLMVYNRWGELVFHSREPSKQWNGLYHGKDAPAGVYAFMLRYQVGRQPRQVVKGQLMLIR